MTTYILVSRQITNLCPEEVAYQQSTAYMIHRFPRTCFHNWETYSQTNRLGHFKLGRPIDRAFKVTVEPMEVTITSLGEHPHSTCYYTMWRRNYWLFVMPQKRQPSCIIHEDNLWGCIPTSRICVRKAETCTYIRSHNSTTWIICSRLAVEIAQAVQEHINTEFQNPDLPFILTPITLLTQKRNSMHEMISREADSSGKERNNLRSYPVISGRRNIYTPYRTAGNGKGQKGMFRSMMSSYLKIKTCIVTIGPWALSPKCSLEKMI